VTRSEKLETLRNAGIEPFLLRLLPEPEGGDLRSFLDSDLLIIDIPPARDPDEMETFHASQINVVKDAVEDLPINKVIYISSTSVYPDTNKELNENSDVKSDKSTKRIILAEEELRIKTKLDATILRCGGLMGYDRIPGKYFAGVKDLNTGHMPVNFVHRDDVIGAIHKIIETNDGNAWNKVFNLVAPKHPTRKEIYLKNAAEFGFEAPTFSEDTTHPWKKINSKKIEQKLGYTFKHPDPMEFPYTAP
jgi:nucleoside-diphosphate-sugar epimerase